jgi:hypothetical protein
MLKILQQMMVTQHIVGWCPGSKHWSNINCNCILGSFWNWKAKNTPADNCNLGHHQLVSGEQTMLKYQLQPQFRFNSKQEHKKFPGRCLQFSTLPVGVQGVQFGQEMLR